MKGEHDQRVSCAALEVYLLTVERAGVSVETYLEGMPFDEAYARRNRNRISWADFCTLTDRLAVIVGGPDGLKQVGRTVTNSPYFAAIQRIMGLLTSPRQLYVFVSTWAQPMMWPMCSSTVTITGPHTLRIHSTLPAGYRPNAGFFQVSAGGMELLPVALGLPMSTVRLETDGREATFEVTHPLSMSLWARVWRAVMLPWRARALLSTQRAQIAELNERLRQLNEARQRAEAAEAVRQELLINISHELRTPMLAILGASEALSAAALPPAPQQDAQLIQEQTARLLGLINDTLDLSRTVAGRLDLDTAPTDPRRLLEDAFAEAAQAASARGLAAALTVSPGVPELVHVDRARLSQVLRHLLGNAVKFTQRGQVSLECSGEWEGARYQLCIAVVDTGAGIPPAWLDKIFDPFTQQDGSLTRQAQGAGLGLSVARGIVEMMGGGLSVESTPGTGSRFTVCLPVSASDSATPRAPVSVQRLPRRAPTPAPAPARPAPAARVLLVEDNPVNQLVLSRQLRALGYAVDTANDGLHGVERFSAARYDLVLMDLQMPRMDGFTAAMQIRTLPGGERVPIVAVTANAHPGYAEQCLEQGMDGFLAKPVPAQRLAETIEACLAAPAPGPVVKPRQHEAL